MLFISDKMKWYIIYGGGNKFVKLKINKPYLLHCYNKICISHMHLLISLFT
jgi:hypothetical protein